MNEILLCSNNPILLKSFYAILRDDGYKVDIAEYPALAVRMAMNRIYDALIIDSEPFGLPVEDAVRIIKTVTPHIVVFFVGENNSGSDSLCIELPINMEEFRLKMKNIRRIQRTH